MRRFEPTELAAFLAAVDAALTAPASIVLIGGSALALGYHVSRATQDIDTVRSETGALRAAASTARAVLGLDIPMQDSSSCRSTTNPASSACSPTLHV